MAQIQIQTWFRLARSCWFNGTLGQSKAVQCGVGGQVLWAGTWQVQETENAGLIEYVAPSRSEIKYG